MTSNPLYNLTSLPIQKLSTTQKGKEWKESCVKYYVSKYQENSASTDDIRICTDLYDGIYSEDDLKYVTNPYKVKEGFPASPHNFNIIKPKIDLLIGELTKRPDSFKVFHTGEEAVSSIQQMKVDALKNYILASVQNEGFTEQENEQRLAELEEYFRGSYVDEAEEAAYHSLNYLKEKLDLENKFIKGFADGLITRKEIYYNGIINGDPWVEKVNPKYFSHDQDPDLENFEDGEWSVYKIPMSITSIHDRLGDLMTESDFDRLIEGASDRPMRNMGSDVNYNPIMRNTPSWLTGEGSTPENILDVYHVTWKSFKKIGFLTLTEETGISTTITVDDTYKELLGEAEEIEWKWVTEVWEGYLIGTDLYVGIQPIENQEFSVDNPNSSKLPYIGSCYARKSLVNVMKPLQYMYIIVWYRLELALARDKGKVLIMDVTQIPKNMGIDIPEFLHYLSAMGVVLVNPYEEGWDTPGRDGGRPSAFNNITAADLTMSSTLVQYINLLAKIEEMIGEVSGVTKQRQGSIENRELVGNVERSVIQSSHITEMLFWTHNNIKKRLLNSLLNTAKIAWARSGKQKLYYIMDDSNRAFLDLSDNFLYSDFGVFVSDSTRENMNIEALRSLLQPAMQSGATLLDASYILTSNNMSMIKNRLKDIEGRRAQMEQRNLEAEQQVSQTTLELQMQKLKLEEEDSIRKSETMIQVALIQAENSAQGGDVNKEPPEIDYKKIEMDSQKMENDMQVKMSKLEEDRRKNRANEELKDKQLRIQSSKQNQTKK